MDNDCLINNIKSKYIINNIFNYIRDEGFEEIFFLYSKKFQNKLKIKFIVLKQKYLKKIGFNLNQFLHTNNDDDKNYLINKYNSFIKEKNINKEKLENFLYDIMENKNEKKVKIFKEGLIDIYSPFFKMMSTTKNLHKYFIINLSFKKYNEDKIKEYNNIFNILNNSNIIYTAINYDLYDNIGKINCLKDININFNNINKIIINTKFYFGKNYDSHLVNSFFETLFSFDNIKNNLIYLEINFNTDVVINSNNLENINNFRKLKYLYLSDINLNKNIIIRLNTLNALSIFRCENIKCPENYYNENLEIFKLGGNRLLSNLNILEKVNFKELNELNLCYNKILDIEILKKLTFKKLEILNLAYNSI